jgi:hypothetical protein
MIKNRYNFLITIFFLLTLTACNLPKPTATPLPGDQGTIQTIAAMTVQALLTQSMASNTPYLPSPTLTPVSTNTQESIISSSPTLTPTTLLSATSTPGLCDQATFISETLPDDTEISPEGKFIKTWTLKNIGTCTWTAGYSLVFVSGDPMTSVVTKAFTTSSIEPGQTVQLSIELQAPSTDGTYRGYWMLRNANGVQFGLGPTASSKFWVQIKVVGEKISYFIDNMCAALWKNGSGTLPCPGASTDKTGFVVRLNAPKLQTGSLENDVALWTNPQAVSGGTIEGKYPAIIVSNGQHFQAVIGCLFGAEKCDVKFSLLYNINNGSDIILQEWNLNYASPITYADVDLSSLAGQSVNFILKVTVLSGADQAQAYWLKPRFEP